MTRGYLIEQIASSIAIRSSLAFPDERIDTLSIDSRKLFQSEGVLFFAIKGEHHDGHVYIHSLLAKGVKNFVVSDESWLDRDDANFLLVDDVVGALQQIARTHRESFSYPVLAITGSNGKTIVKEWLGQVLSGKIRLVKSPRSFNSQVGVPLSVWHMNELHQLAIIEAGISMPGEMLHLQEVIQPSIGLFTNIGDAHSENFSDLVSKVKEKALLFKSCESIYYCSDHQLVSEVLRDTYPNKNHITWGVKANQALQVITRELNNGTEITAIYHSEAFKIHLPHKDKASVENACHCLLLGLELGLDIYTMKERIGQLTPIAMRLEVKKGIQQSVIINDVYNSDLGSLEIALEALQQQTQFKRHTLILSDILQTGLAPGRLVKVLNQFIKQFNIDQFIGIGPVLVGLIDQLNVADKYGFVSTNACLQDIHNIHFDHRAILIKGARSFQLERIVERLEEQAHVTRLEIDFNALIKNLNYFRSQLNSGTKLMAMVKASAYGGGSVQIATQLAFHRIDYLAVAYADEGVELREAGISVPVMVMSPEAKGFEQMIQYNLEPELFNFKNLEAFRSQLRSSSPENLPYPVHIMLDTGMRRLGFEAHEVEELAHELKASPEIRVASVMSHLAASDEFDHDEFTHRQIREFDNMYRQLTQIIDEKPDRHILNSAGISRHPEAQFEMVRLGIGMFGIPRTSEDARKLEPVVSYKTEVVQVKQVPPGESVGYSRMEIATKHMSIATLAIGYADGLPRSLGNRKSFVLVNGERVPIIGNICMDMCMIDVTGLDVQVGDEVEIFGKSRSIVELAEELNTIPYEVLTSVSNRVKRVYFQE